MKRNQRNSGNLMSSGSGSTTSSTGSSSINSIRSNSNSPNPSNSTTKRMSNNNNNHNPGQMSVTGKLGSLFTGSGAGVGISNIPGAPTILSGNLSKSQLTALSRPQPPQPHPLPPTSIISSSAASLASIDHRPPPPLPLPLPLPLQSSNFPPSHPHLHSGHSHQSHSLLTSTSVLTPISSSVSSSSATSSNHVLPSRSDTSIKDSSSSSSSRRSQLDQLSHPHSHHHHQHQQQQHHHAQRIMDYGTAGSVSGAGSSSASLVNLVSNSNSVICPKPPPPPHQSVVGGGKSMEDLFVRHSPCVSPMASSGLTAVPGSGSSFVSSIVGSITAVKSGPLTECPVSYSSPPPSSVLSSHGHHGHSHHSLGLLSQSSSSQQQQLQSQHSSSSSSAASSINDLSNHHHHGQQTPRKKQSTRDPLSHRMIEKRRRDRMNNCLTDLSRLIPNSFIKKSSSLQNRGRIEKTEIIEMAIKYMKHLQNIAEPLLIEDGPLGPSPSSTPVPNIEHDQLFVLCSSHSPNASTLLIKDRYQFYRLGYQESLTETVRFLEEHGLENLCDKLVNHLQTHRENISVGIVSKHMMNSNTIVNYDDFQIPSSLLASGLLGTTTASTTSSSNNNKSPSSGSSGKLMAPDSVSVMGNSHHRSNSPFSFSNGGIGSGHLAPISSRASSTGSNNSGLAVPISTSSVPSSLMGVSGSAHHQPHQQQHHSNPHSLGLHGHHQLPHPSHSQHYGSSLVNGVVVGPSILDESSSSGSSPSNLVINNNNSVGAPSSGKSSQYSLDAIKYMIDASSSSSASLMAGTKLDKTTNNETTSPPDAATVGDGLMDCVGTPTSSTSSSSSSSSLSSLTPANPSSSSPDNDVANQSDHHPSGQKPNQENSDKIGGAILCRDQQSQQLQQQLDDSNGKLGNSASSSEVYNFKKEIKDRFQKVMDARMSDASRNSSSASSFNSESTDGGRSGLNFNSPDFVSGSINQSHYPSSPRESGHPDSVPSCDPSNLFASHHKHKPMMGMSSSDHTDNPTDVYQTVSAKLLMTLSSLITTFTSASDSSAASSSGSSSVVKFVPVFALHPSGQYYVPLSIESSILGLEENNNNGGFNVLNAPHLQRNQNQQQHHNPMLLQAASKLQLKYSTLLSSSGDIGDHDSTNHHQNQKRSSAPDNQHLEGETSENGTSKPVDFKSKKIKLDHSGNEETMPPAGAKVKSFSAATLGGGKHTGGSTVLNNNSMKNENCSLLGNSSDSEFGLPKLSPSPNPVPPQFPPQLSSKSCQSQVNLYPINITVNIAFNRTISLASLFGSIKDLMLAMQMATPSSSSLVVNGESGGGGSTSTSSTSNYCDNKPLITSMMMMNNHHLQNHHYRQESPSGVSGIDLSAHHTSPNSNNNNNNSKTVPNIILNNNNENINSNKSLLNKQLLFGLSSSSTTGGAGGQETTSQGSGATTTAAQMMLMLATAAAVIDGSNRKAPDVYQTQHSDSNLHSKNLSSSNNNSCFVKLGLSSDQIKLESDRLQTGSSTLLYKPSQAPHSMSTSTSSLPSSLLPQSQQSLATFLGQSQSPTTTTATATLLQPQHPTVKLIHSSLSSSSPSKMSIAFPRESSPNPISLTQSTAAPPTSSSSTSSLLSLPHLNQIPHHSPHHSLSNSLSIPMGCSTATSSASIFPTTYSSPFLPPNGTVNNNNNTVGSGTTINPNATQNNRSTDLFSPPISSGSGSMLSAESLSTVASMVGLSPNPYLPPHLAYYSLWQQQMAAAAAVANSHYHPHQQPGGGAGQLDHSKSSSLSGLLSPNQHGSSGVSGASDRLRSSSSSSSSPLVNSNPFMMSLFGNGQLDLAENSTLHGLGNHLSSSSSSNQQQPSATAPAAASQSLHLKSHFDRYNHLFDPNHFLAASNQQQQQLPSTGLASADHFSSLFANNNNNNPNSKNKHHQLAPPVDTTNNSLKHSSSSSLSSIRSLSPLSIRSNLTGGGEGFHNPKTDPHNNSNSGATVGSGGGGTPINLTKEGPKINSIINM